MQPLGLQNLLLSPSGVTGSPAANTGAVTQSAGTRQLGTGNAELAGILPMMLQLMSSVLQMYMTMLGRPSASGAQRDTSSPGARAGTPASGAQADVLGNLVNSLGNSLGGSSALSGALGGSSALGGALGGSPALGGAIGGSSLLGGALGGSPALGGALGGVVSAQTGALNNANVQANLGVNFATLPEAQRAQQTHLNDNLAPTDERRASAIIHIGGRAHISDAETASGVSPSARIYNNILTNPANFKPEEVKMVQEFSAMERAETAALTPDGQGFVTGKYLDYAFIDQMGNRNGSSPEKMAQYKAAVDQRLARIMTPGNPNLAQVIADSRTTVDIVSDVGTLQQRTGLTRTEQAAYRLAGHSVLFSQDGTVNADIMALTYRNANSLDSAANAANGGQDVNIDTEIEALSAADSADDGVVNGSALRRSQESIMDKIFLKQGGLPDNNTVLAQGQQVGLINGRSMANIQQSITSGGMQALADLKAVALDHTPAMLAAGGSMAAASAVCPFLGGMAAGAAGIGAANNQLLQQQ